MSKKIAVTGGIGSGKSLLLQYVKEKGYPVFSCDEIYRELIRTSEYAQKLSSVFPDACVDGRVDKAKLAAIVFNDEEKRRMLNALAHPLIMERLLKNMQTAQGKTVFAEVPLLFEGNYEELFDECIVVLRKLEERERAIRLRDNCTLEEARLRIQAQFDYDSDIAQKQFEKKNVTVIKNENTQRQFYEKIDEYLRKL